MPAITFLMGSDTPGNAFYAEAQRYFVALQSEIVAAPTGGQTLEGVINTLRDRAKLTPPKIYDPINIVTHATGFSSLEFRLRPGSSDIITEDVLADEVIKLNQTPRPADAWPQLAPPVIGPDTKVVLYGCDVGRAIPFLTNLGRMFAEALHIYAPLRVAVFRHANNVSEYRLARTWAVDFDSNITRTQAAQWAAVRAKFRGRADSKFSSHWTASGGFLPMIDPIINASTAAMGPSWFFSETLSFSVPAGTTPAAARALISTVQSAIIVNPPEVDDTTVANVVTPAQFNSTDGRNYVAWIAVLAQIIDAAVDITNAGQYRHIQISPPKGQSPGPAAPAGTIPSGTGSGSGTGTGTGTGTGSGTSSGTTSSLDSWDDVRDALIAGGIEEETLDDLAESEPSTEAAILEEPANPPLPSGDVPYSEMTGDFA